MSKAKKKKVEQAKAEERMLLPEEVADRLRCALGTLANWRNQGKGPPYVKFGGMIRYREADLRRYELENFETPF